MTAQDLQIALIELQAKRAKRLRAMQEKRAELVRIAEEAWKIAKEEMAHFERWLNANRHDTGRHYVESFVSESRTLAARASATLADWDIRNGAILRALEKEISK